VRHLLKAAEVYTLIQPAIAIPRSELILVPMDAVVAAITCFVSSVFGIEAVNKALPPDHQWLNDWEVLIREGDKEFAETLAMAMSQEEFREFPNALMLGLMHGAFAGVHYREGRESEAWADAAYAALCIGVVAGSRMSFPVGLSDLMSKLSEKGVEARHAKMRELKNFAVARYRSAKWASANDAANRLKDEVISEGRKLGANLSLTNAQRTIAEWFRAAEKNVEGAND
jgi:hypothetical protein